MTTIYGIKTCDTMRKAFGWLHDNGVDYTFHDYRTAGIDRDAIERWARVVSWEKLLNKASTTFRALPDPDKAGIDEAKAIDLMLEHPTLIKRPVLETGSTIEVGFKPDRYTAIFQAP